MNYMLNIKVLEINMNVILKINAKDIDTNEISSQIREISYNKKCFNERCFVDKNNIIVDINIQDSSKNIFNIERNNLNHKYKRDYEKLKEFYNRYLFKQYSHLQYSYNKLIPKLYDVTDLDQLVLVNVLGILSVNRVDFVDELEILDIIDGVQNRQDPNTKDTILEKEKHFTPITAINWTEALGCFDNKSKTVYICPKNVDAFFNKYGKTLGVKKEGLLEKVFYHELGHAIFAYQELPFDFSGRKRQECQANYIASDATEGKYDEMIKTMTKKQPKHYRKTLLSKAYYMFSHNSKSYYKLCSAYSAKVKELYKGGSK